MRKKLFTNVMVQGALITMGAAAIAMTTNALRADGIPLITDVEYDIFATCADSDVTSQEVDPTQLLARQTLYVDARQEDAFAAQHVSGAINVPYSVLFGATREDIAKITKAMADRQATSVVVYGRFVDPASPEEPVDLAKPLAEQLIESKVAGVKHIIGGLEELTGRGVPTTTGDGGDK